MSVLKDGHRRRRRYRQRVWALGWSRRPEPTEKGDGRVVGRDGNLRGVHQQRQPLSSGLRLHSRVK